MTEQPSPPLPMCSRERFSFSGSPLFCFWPLPPVFPNDLPSVSETTSGNRAICRALVWHSGTRPWISRSALVFRRAARYKFRSRITLPMGKSKFPTHATSEGPRRSIRFRQRLERLLRSYDQVDLGPIAFALELQRLPIILPGISRHSISSEVRPTAGIRHRRQKQRKRKSCARPRFLVYGSMTVQPFDRSYSGTVRRSSRRPPIIPTDVKSSVRAGGDEQWPVETCRSLPPWKAVAGSLAGRRHHSYRRRRVNRIAEFRPFFSRKQGGTPGGLGAPSATPRDVGPNTPIMHQRAARTCYD